MRERKSLLILKAVVLSAICLITQLAQADQVVNITVPETSAPFTVACTAGGDTVTLSGNHHLLITLTLSNSGTAYHATIHDQPEGISGVGTSGDQYQAGGASQLETNITIGGEETFTNNLRVNDISHGTGCSFLIHELFHVTVDASGNATAFVDTQTVDSR